MYATVYIYSVLSLSLVRLKVRDSEVLAWVRGQKEDESSTGRIWAAGFHHVTARSRLARVLKLMNRLFLQFSNFFCQAAVNRGY
jgi:hypothetical protein